jgi:hypothetical protein
MFGKKFVPYATLNTFTAVAESSSFSAWNQSSGTGGTAMQVRTDNVADFLQLFYYGGSTTGNVIGYISTDSVSTFYGTTSDYRLKDNIQPMVNSLAKILKLKPCTYRMKQQDIESQGFVAHELQEIIPSAVIGKKDAKNINGEALYQGVDPSKIVATLVSAVQELSAQVTDLQAKLEALTK